jgi:cytochrome c oxidase assembly factor CtaG
VATALHAIVDFPFFCPAILVTWCVLWPLLTRLGELELQNRDGG